MSDNSWRYRVGNMEHGPIAAEDLCRLFMGNQVPLDASVWCAPIQRWVPANSIPAFRAAAAAAPNAAPLPPPESVGRFYRTAARMAWSSPVIAIIFTYLASHMLRGLAEGGSTAKPTALILIGCVAGLFILIGFFAGVTALVGAPSHVRRKILVPAVLGLSFNGLLLLGGICAATAARSASASPTEFEADARTSFLEFPGWLGAAKLPGGGTVVVTTLDDQSPTAQRLIGPLHTRCSLVNVTVMKPAGSGAVFYDPISIELLTSGGNLRALPVDAVIAGAPSGTSRLIRRFVGLQAIPADGQPHDAICFIPPGVDLRGVWAVRLDLDGTRVTLPGRLWTATEKQKSYEAGKNRLAKNGHLPQ